MPNKSVCFPIWKAGAGIHPGRLRASSGGIDHIGAVDAAKTRGHSVCRTADSGDTTPYRMTGVNLRSHVHYKNIRTACGGSPVLLSERLFSHAHGRVWREHQRGPPAEVMLRGG